jgi:deazaflavin-dependent oxidoreductase (nitroreductase family)
VDGRPCEPLHFQRWQGGAHLYRDPARLFGDARTVFALDDNWPEVGREIHFPLFYGEDGKNYIIVASKGGAPQHPNWYRNLVANPEVEVQVGTRKLRAKARTATGAERDKLWEKALKFWPPYADYAKKTERQIPVVLLEPAG